MNDQLRSNILWSSSLFKSAWIFKMLKACLSSSLEPAWLVVPYWSNRIVFDSSRYGYWCARMSYWAASMNFSWFLSYTPGGNSNLDSSSSYRSMRGSSVSNNVKASKVLAQIMWAVLRMLLASMSESASYFKMSHFWPNVNLSRFLTNSSANTS